MAKGSGNTRQSKVKNGGKKFRWNRGDNQPVFVGGNVISEQDDLIRQSQNKTK